VPLEPERTRIRLRLRRLRAIARSIGDERALEVIRELIEEAEKQLAELERRSGRAGDYRLLSVSAVPAAPFRNRADRGVFSLRNDEGLVW
jgi:hypothetical protein